MAKRTKATVCNQSPAGEEPRKARAKISENHQGNELETRRCPGTRLMELCSSSWWEMSDFAPNRRLKHAGGTRRRASPQPVAPKPFEIDGRGNFSQHVLGASVASSTNCPPKFHRPDFRGFFCFLNLKSQLLKPV